MDEKKQGAAAPKKKKQTKAGTPADFRYGILLRGTKVFLKSRVRYEWEKGSFERPDGPALYVSNHPSSLDFFGLACSLWPKRIICIANEYYFRKGILKKMLLGIGVIPKKLFQDEGGVILKAKRTVKGGFSLYMAPEARMSIIGETYPIIPSAGAFARFLGVPLVILRLRGGYFNKPKWRPFFIKQTVRVEIREVISAETLKQMTPEAVNERICRGIRNDDFAYAREAGLIFRHKNKAEGLANLIYRCPVCGKLYALQAEGDSLRCPACGMDLTIGEDYFFSENPYGYRSIADLYHALEERERQEDPSLECEVTVRRFHGEEEHAGSGVTRLTPAGFSFSGEVDGRPLSFEIAAKHLKALPFSCGEEFETYYENDLYYFYPKENRAQCARWGLLADLRSEALYSLPEE
ncbi:MAG: 1-acyl-sn-glycerol-3-phosphate acyltransferase [Lachnospiraceae bacterium]|nr:1-acyl-sn-glycerol-3-phosphate acyltransferase [Lachnospiraceae bacterium]